MLEIIDYGVDWHYKYYFRQETLTRQHVWKGLLKMKNSSTEKTGKAKLPNGKVPLPDNSIVEMPVNIHGNRGAVAKLQELFDIISSSWLLTYVGDVQLEKMKTFLHNIRDRSNRRITSGYSYWGIGPALRWNRACQDPLYHMQWNIRSFPKVIERFKDSISGQDYDYVSLGVGEGSKDETVLSSFFSPHADDFTYFPTDMSLDMLRFAIERIQRTDIFPYQRIAIQRDFEDRQGLQDIVAIAHLVGEEKPILYGFIGNTISNLEDPEAMLHMLIEIMRPEDLLLFEAQIIDRTNFSEAALYKAVQEEYESRAFRLFAQSALIQHTDFVIDPNDIQSYEVVLSEETSDVSDKEPVLGVSCYQVNRTGEKIGINFIDGDPVVLEPDEKVRIYRSRKFTKNGVQELVQSSGFEVVDANQRFDRDGTGFLVLLLRTRKNQ